MYNITMAVGDRTIEFAGSTNTRCGKSITTVLASARASERSVVSRHVSQSNSPRSLLNVGQNKDNEQLVALNEFVEDGLIAEVLGIVKSGKEATVYCCSGGPRSSAALLAAKVYRSRDVRRFGDDAMYQEGRLRRRTRISRAIENKSRKGREFAFGAWVSAEYSTLALLYQAGADVPEPIAQSPTVIVMEYVGDEGEPAPPLSSVRLDCAEAQRVFAVIMRNVELLLSLDRVHGDLSAFNVLYRDDGQLRIIDFPQAVDARFNQSALTLLERDIENVVGYLRRFGVDADAQRIARGLWSRFLRSEL